MGKKREFSHAEEFQRSYLNTLLNEGVCNSPILQFNGESVVTFFQRTENRKKKE